MVWQKQHIQEIIEDNCLSKDQLLKYASRQNILNIKVEDLKFINEMVIHRGIGKEDVYKLYDGFNIKDDYLGREPKVYIDKSKIIIPVSLGVQRENNFILVKNILEEIFNKKIKLSFIGNKNDYKNNFIKWTNRFKKTLKNNKIDNIDTVIFGSTYLFKHIFSSDGFFEDLEKLVVSDERINNIIEDSRYKNILKLTIFRNESFVKRVISKNNEFTYFDLIKEKRIDDIGLEKVKNYVNKYFFTNKKFKEIFDKLFIDSYLKKLNIHGYIYYSLREEKAFINKVNLLYKKHLSNIVEIDDEYIKYQIIKINGKNILNFNYCYGPQAKYILDFVFRKFNFNNLFVYGSCGGFNKKFDLGDIITPHASKYESIQYYFDNVLSEGKDINKNILQKKLFIKGAGVMLNVKSPLIETKNFLKSEINIANVDSVEMELYHIVDSMIKNKFNGNFGSIFYVSDKPLENHGLGMPDDLSSGINYITDKFFNTINNIWGKRN